MNSFGYNLKREREAQGISLEQVAAQTKIGFRQLKALEDEQLDALPGGIFTKSFLRQYAQFLRVDEEPIIAEYLKASGTLPEPEPSTSHSQDRSAATDVPKASERLRSPLGLPYDEAPSRAVPRIVLGVACAGVLAGGIFFGLRAIKQRSLRARESAIVKSQIAISAQAVSVPVVPLDPIGSSDTQSGPLPLLAGSAVSKDGALNLVSKNGLPVDARADIVLSSAVPAADAHAIDAVSKPAPRTGVELIVNANHECWMAIAADGQKQFQGNMKPGESRRIEAKETVRLTLGDAGAVTLTMNGQQMPAAGRSGEAKTITVSAKNISQ